jgi:hypothetical protein
MRGIAYKVGDKAAKADSCGSSATLRVSEVTKIENGKMYLDDVKVTIHYHGRMLIINKVYE